MAKMIKCKGCEEEISNAEDECPFCGTKVPKENKKTVKKSTVEAEFRATAMIFTVLLVIGGFLFASAVGNYLIDVIQYNDDNYKTYGYAYKGELSVHEVDVLSKMNTGFAIALGAGVGLKAYNKYVEDMEE